MNRRDFGWMVGVAGVGSMVGPHALGNAAPAASPWKFSVMLWVLSKVAPFDRALEIVAEAGYQGVELTGQSNSWSDVEMVRVMAKMKSLGLVFDMMSGVKSGFCEPNSIAGAGDKLLAELTTQFKMMKRMGCGQVNLKSGPRVDGLAAGAQMAASIENLKRAAELAAASEMQIVIEPIDALESKDMWMTSVSQGFEIARAVNSPHVRVLYDFYHEQRGAGNLLEKLEKNIDLVALVHIADVPGRHEPGTGEVNYPNIYKKLAELKYDKWVTMEFYPTADPVATLKKARLEALEALKTV